MVDEAHFFIRGRIEIPIIGSDELFCWNGWTSVSEQNFIRVNERWKNKQNANPKPRNWQFKTADARIKLTKLYPTI